MSEITEPLLYLERVDPSRNMARFYAMSVQPTLFGELSLVRRWGRIGARGRDKIETFSQPAEIAGARSRIELQKRRRGYQDTQITEIGRREDPPWSKARTLMSEGTLSATSWTAAELTE